MADPMTSRERFLRTMRYQPVDRVPVMALEPFESAGLTRWRTEGLPPGQGPVEFLGGDPHAVVTVGIEPDPPFEQRVLWEDEQYIVETISLGATVRRQKSLPHTFYGHVDHPLKTRGDWVQYRERLRADSPGRLRQGERTAETLKRLNADGRLTGLWLFPCFFRFGFYTMGMERFLSAFLEEPEMMHEIFAHCGRLLVEILKPVLAVGRPDFVAFAEDLAGKNGPLISPRTYVEFWRPHQVPIIRLLREAGVPVICQWSAGQLEPLLPEIVADGFNCTWPLERQAGMDARDVRRRYGREFLLGGNIAKEALLAGPAEIDREIERLRPLIREGGFVPALDDMVPLECPFAHYRYLMERLRGISPGPAEA